MFTRDDGISPQFSSYEHILPIGDIRITEEGVLALMLNLDAKKSPGADGIPNAFFPNTPNGVQSI